MPSKNVTLKVDGEFYDKYRDFGKKKGWQISTQFKIMFEEQMREDE